MAQVDIARISYKGSGPAAAALVGGEVQMAIIDPVAVMGFIKSGKMRVLAVTTAKRVEQLPGVPTVMEAAVPGYEMAVTIGLFAPAAVPREIVNKLYGEIARILNLPDMRGKLVGMGLDPVGYSPEETAVMIRNETAKFGPIIKAANIKLD
jgi:tripartite-type tricarboxylate transporter receptor subunit TctC